MILSNDASKGHDHQRRPKDTYVNVRGNRIMCKKSIRIHILDGVQADANVMHKNDDSRRFNSIFMSNTFQCCPLPIYM